MLITNDTNQGTYVRTTALDILINSFITSTSSSPGPKQIISLGAGTDTRYFRLRARNKHHNVIYHEFDFPLVCDTKRQIVRNHENVFLKEAVMFEDIQQPQDGGNEEGRGEWGIACSVTVDDTPLTQLDADKAAEKAKENKKQYFCHPLDLRHLPTLPSHTSIPGLRPNIPTLIISECCLCYLDPSIASDVIAWFKNKIEALAIILYEPINPDDAFGQMMVGNLKARGIVMPTVGVYRSLGDQVARMRAAGFGGDGDEGIGEGGAEARTVERIWERWITDEERERVDGLEGLDEVEEWQMLARHYAVVWGWTKTLVWELPASVGVGKSS